MTKLVADADSHRLLGMQVIGGGAVDKMADNAVAGISLPDIPSCLLHRQAAIFHPSHVLRQIPPPLPDSAIPRLILPEQAAHPPVRIPSPRPPHTPPG